MLLQPLHSVNYSDFHVSGDVTIQPNVAIAPGVLIQANPGCQITIESGTCIGMGSIIHAFNGKIEIKSGVTIGTGVLIVGDVTVGHNACIGAMTTVFNQEVPASSLILAGSLLSHGDRQPKEVAPEVKQTPEPYTVVVESLSEVQVTKSASDRSETSIVIKESVKSTESSPQVYGQENLNRLLAKLLPHRQSLNLPLNEQ